MKTFFPKLFLGILLSIAASNSIADISGRMLECASGGYAKENKAPAYLSKQLFGANMLFFSEKDGIREKPYYHEKITSEGFGSLRFPGGIVGDNYHWATGETDNPKRRPAGHKRSNNDLSFDEFMAMSKTMAVEPTIVLNYLSWVEKNRFDDGVKEAASWVRYANLEKKYGIKYWELGNEVYAFLPDEHITVQARAYAKDYKAMKKALRAVDPSVHLGAAMPQKLGLTAKFDKAPWWNAFLDEVGDDLDYIVLHNYPPRTANDYINGGTSFPEFLQNVNQIVKSKISRNVPIHITEWNIAQWDEHGKRGLIERDSVWHGLFVAEAILDFAAGDVRLATFWPLRSEKGAGLVSNDTQRYFAGGHVFKLLAPYQGQQFLFDCQGQTTRITRLIENQGSEVGALMIINRGPAQQLDIASIVGKKTRITGLSTFTAENGKYIVKEYSDAEFKELSAKNSTTYPISSGALFIFKLSKQS